MNATLTPEPVTGRPFPSITVCACGSVESMKAVLVSWRASGSSRGRAGSDGQTWVEVTVGSAAVRGTLSRATALLSLTDEAVRCNGARMMRSGTTACTSGCALRRSTSALDTRVATALMRPNVRIRAAPDRRSSVTIGVCALASAAARANMLPRSGGCAGYLITQDHDDIGAG